MIKTSLFCALSAAVLSAEDISPPGPWDNLNPGAGGRIQDIVLDPNTPGRAYYMSDMEGNYRSDDHGETWQFVGEDLRFSNTLTAAVEPGNANRVYTGHVGGIDVSDDAGGSWEYVKEISDPIHQIRIDPADPSRVYAAPGNHVRWEAAGEAYTDNGPIGPLLIWMSTDRGASWQQRVLDAAEGRRDVISLSLTADGRTLYAGTFRGVFRSNDRGDSWTKLPSPAGTGTGWGADISPDGKVLYASFQVSGSPISGPNTKRTHNRIFAAPVSNMEWRDISSGQPGYLDKVPGRPEIQYWRPEVNPVRSGNTHQLLVGPAGWRLGLWQITVTWQNGTPAAVWENIFRYDHEGKEAPKPQFDTGWEQYLPRSFVYQYIPASWGAEGIWTTGDQTLFSVNTRLPDWQNKWKVLYTRFVKELGGERFYRTRGLQCTFVFDGDVHEHYMVQANGDNAIKESYDGGYSWHVGIMKPRSNSAAVVTGVHPPVVLAHISPGYGGSSSEGSLYAKQLVHYTPEDKWIQVAGGPERKAGMSNRLYEQITPDPHHPGRVYVGSQGAGIYLIEDIQTLVNAAKEGQPLPEAERITLRAPRPHPVIVNDKGQGLIADPDHPDTLWIASLNKVFRAQDSHEQRVGEYGNPASSWDFQVIRETGDERTYIDMWRHEDQRYLIATDTVDGEHCLMLSTDEGETWARVTEFSKDILPIRRPKWFDNQHLTLRGPAGYRNKIYLAYSAVHAKRGYGFFEGTIVSPTEVVWKDITGEMIFPLPVKGRVILNQGKAAYYVGTWGNGWWRYNIEEENPAGKRGQ